MSGTPARIVFAGSPEFAVPTLERLVASAHRVVAVLTQPDRPAGRGRHLQSSPVKQSALAHGIEVLQPESLRRDAGAQARILELAPDVIIVVAYGLMVPKAILDAPRAGCINVHASLLPRWRGAAPMQAAILAGDAQTGIAIMRLEEGLDTGPVAASRALAIGPRESAGALHDRLAALGAELLTETLDPILAGTAVFTPQPAAGVTYAPKLSKADATIDWAQPALAIDRRIRAYNPWPVAESRLDGQQLRCWQALPLAAPAGGRAPGTIIATGPQGIDVQTGEGLLRLETVQRAGGKPLPAGEFARGYDVVGKVLGP